MSRIPLFQRYLNDAGDAEAGLVLHTYSAGTLNNKATYTDFGQTVAHTNPVVMDANGYPPNAIYGSGPYRLLLKDSGGNTIIDQDNVIFSSIEEDANGTAIVSKHLNVGGLFDSSKWGDDFYSVDTGSSGSLFVDTSGILRSGTNLYFDGSVYKFKINGLATLRQEEPLTGNVIDFVSDASGSADGAITFVETKRTDRRGNIAYNGTAIPPILSSTYAYEFRAEHVLMVDNRIPVIDGLIYRSRNCYFVSPVNWTLIDSTKSGVLEVIGESNTVFYIPASTADSSFTDPSFAVYEQTLSNGNVNIKTGGTYTSTL